MVDSQPLEWSFSADAPAEDRTRPAEELVEAIRGNRPVTVENAIIEGNVDLTYAKYSHRLSIKNTIFEGPFDASEARFGQSVDLTGCEFRQNVMFFAARIDGQFVLTGVKIHGGEAPAGSEESCQGRNFDQIDVTPPFRRRPVLHAGGRRGGRSPRGDFSGRQSRFRACQNRRSFLLRVEIDDACRDSRRREA